MGGFLGYRGHEAADVPPVLIDRDGPGMQVVVRYPPAARVRARNRCMIAAGLAIASVLTIRPALEIRNGVIRLLVMLFASLSLPGIIASIIMGVLWLQSARTCVIQIDARELRFEMRGHFWTRRRGYRRECIDDIDVATDLRGHAVALVIGSRNAKLQGRYFEYLDERFIREVAGALREGARDRRGLRRSGSAGCRRGCDQARASAVHRGRDR